MRTAARLLPALLLVAALPAWAAGIEHNNGDFTLDVGGGEMMRVKTGTGNVGIGTNNPTAKLDVDGSIRGTAVSAASSSAAINFADRTSGTVSAIYRDANKIRIWSSGVGDHVYITTGGAVGIGSSAPATKLDVDGGITASGQVNAGAAIISSGASAGYRMFDRTNTSRYTTFWRNENYTYLSDDANGVIFRVGAGGELYTLGALGLGRAPSYKLDVDGNVRITGSGGTCTMNGGSGSTTCGSDIRLKDRIRPLDDPFPRLAQIKPVTFHWKNPKRAGPERLGVIAQDVEKAYPQLVGTIKDPDENEAEFKGVDYAGLVVPLIEAVNRLKVDNDKLRRDFEAYRAAHP